MVATEHVFSTGWEMEQQGDKFRGYLRISEAILWVKPVSCAMQKIVVLWYCDVHISHYDAYCPVKYG